MRCRRLLGFGCHMRASRCALVAKGVGEGRTLLCLILHLYLGKLLKRFVRHSSEHVLGTLCKRQMRFGRGPGNNCVIARAMLCYDRSASLQALRQWCNAMQALAVLTCLACTEELLEWLVIGAHRCAQATKGERTRVQTQTQQIQGVT